MLRNIIIGLIISIGIFIGGVFTGRFYYAKEEIKVGEVKTEDTQWKDKYLQLKQKLAKVSKKPTLTKEEFFGISLEDFNNLVHCYNSPLDSSYYTDANYIYITVGDTCKETQMQYEILTKTKFNWKIGIIIGSICFIGGGILAYKIMR